MTFDTSHGQTAVNIVTNGTAAGIVISAVLSFLPPTAAMVALVWYFIQIWESKTVRGWVSRRRTRKLARMKAAVLLMEAQMQPPLPGPEEKNG